MENLIDFSDTLVDVDDPLSNEINALMLSGDDGGGEHRDDGAERKAAAGRSATMNAPGGGFGVNDGEPARAFVTISQVRQDTRL